MMSRANEGAGTADYSESFGSSTEQHITGSEETGIFTTDKAPTSDTPADGSSNAGINATHGDQPDHATDDDRPEAER